MGMETINKTYIRWANNENYLIFDDGKIYSLTSKKFLKPRIQDGYYIVHLYVNNKNKPYRIHRLVASCFVNNPEPSIRDVVNHKDFNRLNNHFSNLEWTTVRENTMHYVNSIHYKPTGQSKKVDQIDVLKNKIIATFENSKDASEQTSISIDVIRGRCNGSVKTNIKINNRIFTFQYNTENIISEIPKNSKQIEGLTNFWITNDGRVYSTYTKKFITLQDKCGYRACALNKKWYRVHRIVAKHFLENDDPKNKTIVNHIDSNRSNNHVSNLEWCTPSENIQHAVDFGNSAKTKKAVKQISIETTNVINIFDSAKKASLACNIRDCNISRCCRDNLKGNFIHTAGGFRWEFVNTVVSTNIFNAPEIAITLTANKISNKNKNTQTNGKRHEKSIIVYNDKDVLISIFSSVSCAAKEMHMDASSISKYCNGKMKPRNNYKWQYLKDNLEMSECFAQMSIDLY
jgi:hypothetical protein